MKTKFFLVIVAAIFILGCGLKPTEVVIERGERISAPSDVRVYRVNDAYNDSIEISFAPAANALTHAIYASHSDSKKPFYGVTASNIGGYYGETLTYSVRKSNFEQGAFFNYSGNQVVDFWPLGALRYIGVASFSYGGVPSDIKWVDVNPRSGTYNPGGNVDYPQDYGPGGYYPGGEYPNVEQGGNSPPSYP